MFEAILEDLRAFNRIIIHRHGRPDGDAIGSQVGLKYIIKENFPEKEVYAVGDAPGFFGFVEGSTPDEIPDSYYEDALAVILDCGGVNMINDDRYTLAKKTVRMDHHLFTGAIADNEVIDSSYESCCGLVAAFAQQCGLALTPIAAKALYTGMVTDSGRFKYSGKDFVLVLGYGAELDLLGLHEDEQTQSKQGEGQLIAGIGHGFDGLFGDIHQGGIGNIFNQEECIVQEGTECIQ